MNELETCRQIMEEIESFETGIVEELESVPRKSHRSKLAQEIRIRNMLQGAQERAKRFKSIKLDSTPQGGLPKFFEKRQNLQEQHALEGDDVIIDEPEPSQIVSICSLGGEMPFVSEEEERMIWRPRNRLERRMARAKIDEFVLSKKIFTGEEYYGRYLDLHELHLMFQNLHPNYRRVSYLEYLRKRLTELPPICPASSETDYAKYLLALKKYLEEFELRARPLTIFAEEDDKNHNLYDAQLQKANSVSELEKLLTMQQLKDALQARGLKSSGTIQQRASRLFAVKNLQPDQYPLELISTSISTQIDVSKIKQLEEKISQIFLRLKPFIQATIVMITKKLTMTFEEIAQELKDEEREHEAIEKSDEEDNNEEEEEETKFRNNGIVDPGTGRVIPKWMYRLHGLNQEFKCEICGGQSYFGRRNYDRHFKDFRHSNGMRALGIPNTSHFLDITSIDDAIKLYHSLKKELEKSEFNRGAEEEFEDSQGNVMNRAAYEDLKREGYL